MQSRVAFIGVAFFVALSGPAASQRVCQPNDTDCSNSRMHAQREQTLRRLQAEQGRQHGNKHPAGLGVGAVPQGPAAQA